MSLTFPLPLSVNDLNSVVEITLDAIESSAHPFSFALDISAFEPSIDPFVAAQGQPEPIRRVDFSPIHVMFF